MFDALARAFADLWKKLNAAGMPQKPAAQPAPQPVSAAPEPAPTLAPVRPAALTGPFRYLIAVDDVLDGKDGEIFETGYNSKKPKKGRFFRYGNLYDQTGSGMYGPYVQSTDTATTYNERVVNWNGDGWRKLLADQCHGAIAAGAEGIEWDNPDGYPLDAVMDAVNYAASRGLDVLAKNPLACSFDPLPYIKHLAVVGVIVERGAGSPADMDVLRVKAGKPQLLVRFVAFKDAKEDGRAWAGNTARQAANYKNMAVTISLDGEYTSSTDVQGPWPTQSPAPAEAPKPVQQPVSAPIRSDDPNNKYAKWWTAAEVRAERHVEFIGICKSIIANRSRYEVIESKCGVPWFVVAVLHMRESDFNWNTYLGNGDPLNRRTTHVPAGRGPFATFEDGAADALALDGLNQVKDWDIKTALYQCEKFNGMGYANRGMPSPYVWAGTTIYTKGKYIADGEFSSSAVDAQPGCAAILKLLFPMLAGAAIEPPKPVPHPDAPELHDLGHRIKRAMLAKGYPWFDDQNVVSIEGMDPDGSLNANRANAFDDMKCVIDGEGKIIGGPWEATTHPGFYWTQHPMAEGGAFIIALGPQAAWGPPGDYHGNEVWRQTEDGFIFGHRDPNCTYKRQGPPIKHGPPSIGVHHHHGYNLPKDNIENAAAGCQVIRLNDKQEEFMRLTKKCPRYLADPHGYRLTATVIEAKELLP